MSDIRSRMRALVRGMGRHEQQSRGGEKRDERKSHAGPLANHLSSRGSLVDSDLITSNIGGFLNNAGPQKVPRPLISHTQYRVK